MTIRTMSSNEAKQNWGQVMALSDEPGTTLVIESHGKPKVVVISYEEFTAIQEISESRRRADSIRKLRELTANIGNRNADLREEEADALAVEIGREINQAVAEQHATKFQKQATS